MKRRPQSDPLFDLLGPDLSARGLYQNAKRSVDGAKVGLLCIQKGRMNDTLV